MRKIDKRIEPQFWTAYRKKHPQYVYRDLDNSTEGRNVRRKLRYQLVQNQCYICAYCCRRIDVDSSLNEHLKPEDKYPHYTMEFENLVAACNNVKEEKACSLLKANRYNEQLFISPFDEDCESHFAYIPNGEIIGTSEKGKYMIQLLGLNSLPLKQARAASLKKTEWCNENNISIFLEPTDGKVEPFINIIEYFHRNGFYQSES